MDMVYNVLGISDEGQPRPKYIFNKCGTNIYFVTLQRFGPSPSPNFKYICYKMVFFPGVHESCKNRSGISGSESDVHESGAHRSGAHRSGIHGSGMHGDGILESGFHWSCIFVSVILSSCIFGSGIHASVVHECGV